MPSHQHLARPRRARSLLACDQPPRAGCIAHGAPPVAGDAPSPQRPLRGLLLSAGVVFSLIGCGERTVIVYQQPAPAPTTTVVETVPGPVYAPPPPPPQQQIIIADDPQSQDEVNTVIYREYYGLSEDEVYMIPHYRRYYHVDDDDLFFVAFVARQARVPFDVAFNQFYFGCGGDYNRMLVVYNVDPVVFFMPMPYGVVYPPIYARPYGFYSGRPMVGMQFSPDEFHAMISLRIGVEYQGYGPDVFFRNTIYYGSPRRAMYQGRDRCGSGGHACGGFELRIYVHPWGLAPGARASWHSNMDNHRASREGFFREQHRDQIERVNRGEGYHHPGAGPGPRVGDRPGDRPGEHPDNRGLGDPNHPENHGPGDANHPESHDQGQGQNHPPGQQGQQKPQGKPESQPKKQPSDKEKPEH